MEKVNLQEKFSLFSEHFKPRIAGELNGRQVKFVKFDGPFVWHHHGISTDPAIGGEGPIPHGVS